MKHRVVNRILGDFLVSFFKSRSHLKKGVTTVTPAYLGRLLNGKHSVTIGAFIEMFWELEYDVKITLVPRARENGARANSVSIRKELVLNFNCPAEQSPLPSVPSSSLPLDNRVGAGKVKVS